MPVEAIRPADNDETDLIARVRRKDASAVALIIRQNNQRLYRIARSILRDDFEAEDALQEAYIRAFTRLDLFRGESQLGTWLARIVMNEALGRLRRRKPTVAFETGTHAQETSAEIIRFPLPIPSSIRKPRWPNAKSARFWSAPSTPCRRPSAPFWSCGSSKA